MCKKFTATLKFVFQSLLLIEIFGMCIVGLTHFIAWFVGEGFPTSHYILAPIVIFGVFIIVWIGAYIIDRIFRW